MSTSSDYTFQIEGVAVFMSDFMPLMKAHHAEMNERLEREGIKTTPFEMDVAAYHRSSELGQVRFYTVRKNGLPVGYCLIDIFQNLHSKNTLIAREEALYMTPDCRDGTGLKFYKTVLDDLKNSGAVTITSQAVTDPRFVNILKRLGFKAAATIMIREI